MQNKNLNKAANGLPLQLSAFIGRECEISEVKQLLSEHRLLTLTGAGGSGKTRLSLRVAVEVTDKFKDGIWYIEFASVYDPTLVPEIAAAAMNIREQSGQLLMDVIISQFSTLEALLIMDNCEHLISACAQFAETILQRCPDLKILSTSREVLGIPGEIVWSVPPLSLPAGELRSNSAEEVLRHYRASEAVQLFVTRAKANSPKFQLTIDNGAYIAEICYRLDGLPLAIELAAARVRSLSVQQIAERLNDRFRFLIIGNRTAPPRQQTLEATIDWSYTLLSIAEQKVLQRMSVFAGGATLNAVEYVCKDEGKSILDVLSRLVDKSLVTAKRLEVGEMRYLLLETIRQYASQKLEESADVVETRNRHLEYYVQYVYDAEPYLNEGQQEVWLQRFELENDNLRAALEWSSLSADRVEMGLRLSSITANFWKLHGHYKEGRLRLGVLLNHEAAKQQTLLRARTLYSVCVLAFYQSDYPAVKVLAEESLSIFKKHGPEGRLGVANVLKMLSLVASETGDYLAAIRLGNEALPIYREVGYLLGVSDTLRMMCFTDLRMGNFGQIELRLSEALTISRQINSQHATASSLCALGEFLIRQGQVDQAQILLEEGLKVSQEIGEKRGASIALGSLGWLALYQGNYEETRKFLKQSLDIRLETGDQSGIAWCLEKLAETNYLQSHFQPAAVILGIAAALRAPVGSTINLVDRPSYESMISKLLTTLGKDNFEAAWMEGQSMPLRSAIDYALAEQKTEKTEAALKGKIGGLTERERETAELIAQGKSNREIAKVMTVGVKTVETYVTRILKKLRFDSRVQIAAWMIEKNFNNKRNGETR